MTPGFENCLQGFRPSVTSAGDTRGAYSPVAWRTAVYLSLRICDSTVRKSLKFSWSCFLTDHRDKRPSRWLARRSSIRHRNWAIGSPEIADFRVFMLSCREECGGSAASPGIQCRFRARPIPENARTVRQPWGWLWNTAYASVNASQHELGGERRGADPNAGSPGNFAMRDRLTPVPFYNHRPERTGNEF